MLGVWEAVCVRDRFCWVPVVLVLWKGPREQETEAKGPEGENEGRCNSVFSFDFCNLYSFERDCSFPIGWSTAAVPTAAGAVRGSGKPESTAELRLDLVSRDIPEGPSLAPQMSTP